MNAGYYLKKAASMPPHEVLRRVLARVQNHTQLSLRGWRDLHRDTRASKWPSLSGQHFFPISKPLELPDKIIKSLVTKFTCHQFQILGNEWVATGYESGARGNEGFKYEMNLVTHSATLQEMIPRVLSPSHIPYALEILRDLNVPQEYIPIDWQKDFRSGYRFSARSPYHQNNPAPHPGVDIKFAWELGRLQHLPLYARLYQVTTDSRLLHDFAGQLIDFVVCNPPRMGVHWRCPMEIGIRAANVLVAYDLFSQLCPLSSFNQSFSDLVARLAYEHGLHIFRNLEWSNGNRNNHYLANIVGLIFIASYLEPTEETNNWLHFGISELIHEIRYQFNTDGTHFEGSTSYHRLASEMVVYAIALVIALPQARLSSFPPTARDVGVKIPRRPSLNSGDYASSSDPLFPFPNWIRNRLEQMGEFSQCVSGISGEGIQIGDNDSGRFLKLSPDYETQGEILVEKQNNHQPVVAALSGFFARPDFINFSGENRYETVVTKSLLARGKKFATVERPSSFVSLPLLVQTGPGNLTLLDNIQKFHFPSFGIVIFKSNLLFLSLRATPARNSHSGHFHNDELSITLEIDSEYIFHDPGSYLYTSIPARRNLFRSTFMHNTLQLSDQEQNPLNQDPRSLFSLGHTTNSSIDSSESNFVQATHYGFSTAFTRKILIAAQTIYGEEQIHSPLSKAIHFHVPGAHRVVIKTSEVVEISTARNVYNLQSLDGVWSVKQSHYSPGYGILNKAWALTLTTDKSLIKWQLAKSIL